MTGKRYRWWLLAGRVALVTVLVALTRAASTPTTQAQTPSFLEEGVWQTIANGNNIWALAKEGEHTLWAGGWAGGLVRWDLTDPAHPTYRQYLYPQDPIPSNDVRSIAVDQAGNKWIATPKGLVRLGADESWTTYTLHGTLRPSTTVADQVLRTTDSGVREVTVKGFSIDIIEANFKTPYIQFEGDPTVYRFSRADLVLTGPYRGDNAIYIDPPLQQAVAPDTPIYLMNVGLPSDNVTAVAVAPDGKVWVGTQQYRTTVDPGDCYAPDRGAIVRGVDFYCDGMRYLGGGVARFDPQTDEWATWRPAKRPYYYTSENIASNNVTDIEIDPRTGQVWATFIPMWRWAEPDRTNSGNPNKKGSWRSGGDGGVSVFENEGWTTFQHYQCDTRIDTIGCQNGTKPQVNSVSSVTIDSQGRKWFAVFGANISVVDGAGASANWKQITRRVTYDSNGDVTGEGLSDYSFYALATDSQDRLWVATVDQTSGVGKNIDIGRTDCLVATPTEIGCWTHLRASEGGLASNTVRSILRDGDHMWLGLSDLRGNGEGVQQFDLQLNKTQHLKTHGPASNNMTQLSFSPQGELWMGSGRMDAIFYGKGVSILKTPNGDWHNSDAWTYYETKEIKGVQVATVKTSYGVDETTIYVNTAPNNSQAECTALADEFKRGKVYFGDDPHGYPVYIVGYDSRSSVLACYIWLNEGLRQSVTAGEPVYPVDLELTGNSVTDIEFDSRGAAWIGTKGEQVKDYGFNNRQYFDGGLNVFDGVRWRNYQQQLPPPNPTSPPGTTIKGNSVTALQIRGGQCETPEKVYVGMAGFLDNIGWGIDVVNYSSPRPVTSLDNSVMPSSAVADIALDPTTCDIWAAFHPSLRFTPGADGVLVPGGVGRFKPAENVWASYSLENTPALEGYLTDYRSVYVDRQGRAWAGSYTVHATTPGSTAVCINCAPDWVIGEGHTDAILNRFENNTWQTAIHWNYEGYVSDMLQDRDGRLWVATTHDWIADSTSEFNWMVDTSIGYPLTDTAVHVLDNNTWTALKLSEFPFPDDNIASIAEAPNGDLWFGTSHHGLVHWNRSVVAETPTPTTTATVTSTPGPTRTATRTPSPTRTLTPPPGPTATPTLTRTASPTRTVTPTVPPGTTVLPPTPTATDTRPPTKTATPTPRSPVYYVYMPLVVGGQRDVEVKPTLTPTATSNLPPAPSLTPTRTASAPTSTRTPIPGITGAPPTKTATATEPVETLEPTATETTVPTDTPEPTETLEPTGTPTVALTPTRTRTTTPTRTASPTPPPTWEGVTSGTASNLRSIDCVDSLNCWAVGDGGVILRWDGRTWSQQLAPINKNLNSVDMVSKTEGWAVGDDKTILRYNNGNWTQWDLSDVPDAPSGNYVAVVMVPGATGRAPGGFILSRSTARQIPYLYWDRSSGRWLLSRISEEAVLMNNMFAVPDGSYGVAVGNTASIHKYLGQDSWFIDGSSVDFSRVPHLYNAHLYQWASDALPVGWIVGQNSFFAYYTGADCRSSPPCWDEASGAMVAGVPATDYYDVQVVARNRAWAVGDGGVIVRWDGSRWTQDAAVGGGALRGLYMLSTQEGWAVGDGGRIVRYRIPNAPPIATPTAGPSPTLPLSTPLATATSLTSPTPTLTATETATATATATASPTRTATAQPATATRTPTAVSPVNTPVPGAPTLTPTATRTATAIATTGPTPTAAPVGVWTRVESPTGATLHAVTFVSADEGWAVGEGGTILHYTGGRWRVEDSPTTERLNAISMLSAFEGWIVGENTTLLRYSSGRWVLEDTDVFRSVRDYKTLVGITMLRTPPALAPRISGFAVAHEGGFLYYDRLDRVWRGERAGAYNSDADKGPNALHIASDGGYGAIVGDGGAILETFFDGNSNVSWTELGLPGRNNSYGVYVIPDPTGVLAKYYGWYVGLASDFYFYQTNPSGEGCGFEGTRRPPCWGTFNTGLRTAGNVYYRSVHLVNKNDGWTVGDGMAIAHWDGRQWREYPEGHIPFISSLDPNLYGVWMTDSNSGWAVGSTGTILRYTGR